jgi:hypothetical protein
MSHLFVRAGGLAPKKKQSTLSVEAGSSKNGSSSVNSPKKLIDGRSKCYKQMSDLHSNVCRSFHLSLRNNYEEQKKAIMVTLKIVLSSHYYCQNNVATKFAKVHALL